ncbi:MAG: 23S rRNA (adenine(2503)-C(2))-methyltransferase RlmN [Alphaproteobacteria bacterium]
MAHDKHAKAFAAPKLAADGRQMLIGMNIDQMEQAVLDRGLPKFRARQMYQWLYAKGATEFEQMTNLPKTLRDELAAEFSLERPEAVRDLTSTDGTRKWLLRMADGQEVETVFIPETDRGALCVSSQVGCTLTCRFCHTGTQKLVRNLGPAEIVSQVMLARDRLGNEWPAGREDRMLTNIVLMGMGEPLYNYDNLAHAMKIVMDGDGMSISKRRITLSTSGVVPAIRKAGEELGVNLAISLHGVTNDVRSAIMPINNKYPLEELMDACRNYPSLSNARRITFEYVMLKGVNDSLADAKGLVQLIKGIPAKVNLIPFNPWPGAPYECSDRKTIEAFAEYVYKAGYSAPIRATRGEDIMAACGQLKSASERLRKGRVKKSAEEAA